MSRRKQLNRRLFDLPALQPLGRAIYARRDQDQTKAQSTATKFFRNLDQLTALEGPLRALTQSERLRVLVVGCSMGCEAYSLAAYLEERFPGLDWRIDGVDVSDEALAVAQGGVYGREHGLGTPLSDLGRRLEERLFLRDDERWIVREPFRERATYAYGDVLSPDFSRYRDYDLVLGQNFLIHMSPEDGERAFAALVAAARPGGALFVGGMPLDARPALIEAHGLTALDWNIAAIHDADEMRRSAWPWSYWSLEPIDRRAKPFVARYATILLKPEPQARALDKAAEPLGALAADEIPGAPPMTTLIDRTDWAVELAKTAARRAGRRDRTVGYIGWTQAGNLGDDAMLEAARLLFSGQDIEVFAGARREILLDRFGLSGAQHFARVFLGGGTLINEGYLDVVRRALAFGVPVSTLGTGVGSSGFASATEDVSPEWREALRGFRRIGVRGPHSLARLNALGVDKAEVVGDLALALTPDAPLGDPDARRFLLNAAAPGPADPGFPTERMFDELTQAAQLLLTRGWTAVPIAMSVHDIEPTRRVLRQVGIEDPAVHAPRRSADFFALAKGASLALGVRLHCAVLASCVGVAPLAVAYRSKARDFAASMSLDEFVLDADALSGGALAYRAEVLLERLGEVGAQAHARALGWREALRRYVADA